MSGETPPLSQVKGSVGQHLKHRLSTATQDPPAPKVAQTQKGDRRPGRPILGPRPKIAAALLAAPRPPIGPPPLKEYFLRGSEQVTLSREDIATMPTDDLFEVRLEAIQRRRGLDSLVVNITKEIDERAQAAVDGLSSRGSSALSPPDAPSPPATPPSQRVEEPQDAPRPSKRPRPSSAYSSN